MHLYRLYIFDADWTLRWCTVPGQPCPNNNDEWELYPDVIEKLASIQWGNGVAGKTGPYLAVASNQSGVQYGYTTEGKAYALLANMTNKMFRQIDGAPLPDYVYLTACYQQDLIRYKPAPGMLWEAMLHFKIPQNETLFIGDSDTDEMAAKRAGIDFVYAAEFFCRETSNLDPSQEHFNGS